MVADGQVRSLRAGLRPVAGPRPDMRGQLPGRDHPAPGALLGLLDDLRRRRRDDIGDLMTAPRRHRLTSQVRAAPAACGRRALDGLIRVIHQAHRRPGVAGLLSRPPFPPLSQRPAGTLLPVRAIGRRRTRRRGRVLAGLPLQLLHPCRQALCLLSQPPGPRSSAISRYASASRTASSAGGRADSSSAEGTPGTPVTPGNDQHSGQPVSNQHRRVTSHPPAATVPAQGRPAPRHQVSRVRCSSPVRELTSGMRIVAGGKLRRPRGRALPGRATLRGQRGRLPYQKSFAARDPSHRQSADE